MAATSNQIEHRTCSKCGIAKPLDAIFFYRVADGFEKRCKSCRNELPPGEELPSTKKLIANLPSMIEKIKKVTKKKSTKTGDEQPEDTLIETPPPAVIPMTVEKPKKSKKGAKK